MYAKFFLLHKDYAFKYESHPNKFELKGHTICSKAEIPGFRLYFWQPSSWQHLAINGVLSELSAFISLDSRLSLSRGTICLDLKRDVLLSLTQQLLCLPMVQNCWLEHCTVRCCCSEEILQGSDSNVTLFFPFIWWIIFVFHSLITIHWLYTLYSANKY